MEANLGNVRILVMDDEPLILQTTCEMLEMAGFQALSFSQGKDVVDFVRAEVSHHRSVEMILMDLNIPKGMGGLEASQLIREFNTTVPIILTSGYSTDDVLVRPEVYGVSGSLKKTLSTRRFDGGCESMGADAKEIVGDKRKMAK